MLTHKVYMLQFLLCPLKVIVHIQALIVHIQATIVQDHKTKHTSIGTTVHIRFSSKNALSSFISGHKAKFTSECAPENLRTD
jgi:hypothetical protein